MDEIIKALTPTKFHEQHGYPVYTIEQMDNKNQLKIEIFLVLGVVLGYILGYLQWGRT